MGDLEFFDDEGVLPGEESVAASEVIPVVHDPEPALTPAQQVVRQYQADKARDAGDPDPGDVDESIDDHLLEPIRGGHEPYPVPQPNLFPTMPPKLAPDWYCRARRFIRHGEDAGNYKYCYSRAGAGTNHLGEGRCKYHGGRLPAVVARYESEKSNLRDLLDHFLRDPTPLDLHSELAVARAVTQMELESYEELRDALLAWHASFEKENRGLHDAPLFHVGVIRTAVQMGLFEDVDDDTTEQEILERMEIALNSYQEPWRKRANGQPINMRVNKPRAVPSYKNVLNGLTTISRLVNDISKLEADAYLSAFAVEAALTRYGEIVRSILASTLREKGFDIEEASRVVDTIAIRWQQVPLAESSVPRLSSSLPREQK